MPGLPPAPSRVFAARETKTWPYSGEALVLVAGRQAGSSAALTL